MDEDLQEQARAWLAEKWSNPDKSCPICKTVNDWGILGIVYPETTQPPITYDSLLRGERIPALQLACRNCGYLLSFSARIAGLVPIDLTEVSDEKERVTRSAQP